MMDYVTFLEQLWLCPCGPPPDAIDRVRVFRLQSFFSLATALAVVVKGLASCQIPLIFADIAVSWISFLVTDGHHEGQSSRSSSA
jgi:hypothetical protein